ncbi:carbohydrate ABC transporter permease [Pseudonocardia xinjiangensis]|uniref:Carbohydrate ABC transporter permease n=1 Tax=Pseudonocardia xinjiangensis TaxID=75289 RepID=A0ABX1RLJ2_9PSEU|nr:carbohydrate ABC transporter permease [Pseudonocardia xinjiangensis]NMH80842.1 carbohydrate ABC transporter permease [Pseudonocardia xinjiangensis]
MSTPTSTRPVVPAGAEPVAAQPVPRRPARWLVGRAGRRSDDQPPRGIVSDAERRTPVVRVALRLTHAVVLVALVVVGLGPILWLVKASISTTQDTLRSPMALFPSGVDWANLATAWSTVHIDLHFANSMIIATGAWLVQLVVATTGGYALSVLRPRYGPILYWLVLSTLFVPAVVLLVPLYLTVLDPPLLGVSLINSFWAVWLPAGANAFNVLLTKRFFDNLPREIFEAARIDGAGPYRIFWSVLLPMSRPILGVVSVFAFIAAWKDFLWPLLVLPDPDVQPLSVRLPTLARSIELDVLLAALTISALIPMVLFLVFQRTFLRSAGLSGALKG